MIFKLDFNLEAWIKDVEVEAETVEEAIAKLDKMSVAEILFEETSGFVKDKVISEVTSEVVAFDLEVEATDISLDKSNGELSFSQLAELERQFNQQPMRLKLSNVVNTDDIEEAIKEEIWLTHKVDVLSLNYRIINKF